MGRRVMASAGRPQRRVPVAPVVVEQLPVVRCAVCWRVLPHRPGEASLALKVHYQEAHPDRTG